MSKPTALTFAQQGDKYLGTPYSQMDCQKLYEQMLADVGIRIDKKGSNAWYRAMDWTGTPEEGTGRRNDYSSKCLHELSKFESISIASTVQTIGIDSFKNCLGLTEVTIPGSVKTVGGFTGCSNLQSVVLCDGVIQLSDYVFENCASLTSIITPSTLSSIGYCAFRNCTQITQVNLSSGLFI